MQLGERGLHNAAWVVAEIENKASQMSGRKLFDGIVQFLRGVRVPTGDADVRIAGLQEEGAVDGGRVDEFGRECERKWVGEALAANIGGDFLLASLREELDDLLGLKGLDGDVVDGDELVAGLDAGFIRGRAWKGLQENDLARQDGDHTSETLLLGLLHLFELLELGLIEELGVRIELVKHGRDGALVNRFFGGGGIGGLCFESGEDVDELFEVGVDFGRGVFLRRRGRLGGRRSLRLLRQGQACGQGKKAHAFHREYWVACRAWARSKARSIRVSSNCE